MFKIFDKGLVDMEKKEIDDFLTDAGLIKVYVEEIEINLKKFRSGDKPKDEAENAIKDYLRLVLEKLHHGERTAKRIIKEELNREKLE